MQEKNALKYNLIKKAVHFCVRFMGHSTSFKYYLVCMPHIWINSFFESFMKIGRKMLDFHDFDKSQMFLRDSLIQLWKQVLQNIIPLQKEHGKGSLLFSARLNSNCEAGN